MEPNSTSEESSNSKDADPNSDVQKGFIFFIASFAGISGLIILALSILTLVMGQLFL